MNPCEVFTPEIVTLLVFANLMGAVCYLLDR